MKALAGLLITVALAACDAAEPSDTAKTSGLEPTESVSGYTFLTPETQAQQDDDFLNPGFLWVDQGEDLFTKAEGNAASCMSCHDGNGIDLTGAATHYPAIDEPSGALVNLEGRINLCRTRHQKTDALAYESEALLALTAYVASLSRGAPMAVSIDERTEPFYEAGERYFFTRRGQLNLSCHQCHNQNWGKRLRGDTISQGHGNGFPAYRLEWQSLGSLHRRLRDCDAGVRAEPREYGSDDYLALELYLAKRSEGLTVETPAVRR